MEVISEKKYFKIGVKGTGQKLHTLEPRNLHRVAGHQWIWI